MKKLLSTLTEGQESQLHPDFYRDDNDVEKKEKIITKFSNTKVKTRNLLTNISYRRYNPEDVEKKTLLSMFFRF